jgi:hypothetical protein
MIIVFSHYQWWTVIVNIDIIGGGLSLSSLSLSVADRHCHHYRWWIVIVIIDGGLSLS